MLYDVPMHIICIHDMPMTGELRLCSMMNVLP